MLASTVFIILSVLCSIVTAAQSGSSDPASHVIACLHEAIGKYENGVREDEEKIIVAEVKIIAAFKVLGEQLKADKRKVSDSMWKVQFSKNLEADYFSKALYLCPETDDIGKKIWEAADSLKSLMEKYFSLPKSFVDLLHADQIYGAVLLGFMPFGFVDKVVVECIKSNKNVALLEPILPYSPSDIMIASGEYSVLSEQELAVLRKQVLHCGHIGHACRYYEDNKNGQLEDEESQHQIQLTRLEKLKYLNSVISTVLADPQSFRQQLLEMLREMVHYKDCRDFIYFLYPASRANAVKDLFQAKDNLIEDNPALYKIYTNELTPEEIESADLSGYIGRINEALKKETKL